MNPLQNLSRIAAVALGSAITSLTAAPVIHEPFAQTAGSISGKAGGTGLNNWVVVSTASTVATTPTLVYGQLANSDGQLSVPSGGGITAYVTTTSVLADANLLDDGAAVWFSYLYSKGSGGGSNERSGFAFGTDHLITSGTSGAFMSNSGNGLGVYSRDRSIQPSAWRNGGGGTQVTGTSFPAYNDTVLVVGRIVWGATAGDVETLTIWTPNLTSLPLTQAGLGAGWSITMAGVDQTQFDTISMQQRNSGSAQLYDEVRFGSSYAVVVPNTADAVDPLLASTVPANNGTTDGLLQAVFNEFVAIGTGDIRIYDVNDTVTPHTTIAITDASQVSHDGFSTFTIIPTTRLASGETYYVEMDAGIVKDQGGNDFAGFTGDTIWKFTADDTAPTVTAFTSEIGTGDIYVGMPSPEIYTLTFDKRMDATTITSADFDNDGTATVNITVTPIDFYTFKVEVAPVTAGTLTLRLLSANTVSDLTGNDLAAPVSGPSKDVRAVPYSPTFTGITNTTYTTTSNWDEGFLPLRDWSATIAAAKTAVANSGSIPTYSGGLTLKAGSQLTISSTVGSVNAMGTGPITAEGNSIIQITITASPLSFPALVLDNNLTVTASSNTEDNKARNFPGTISGTGKLTYNMRRGTTITLSANNSTWSGGFVANNTDKVSTNYSRVRADNGGFGTGDVTINDGISLEILSGRSDVIDDGAALYLIGTGRTDIRKLVLGSNETVNEFWLDGVQLLAGTYTSASGLVDNLNNPLITGSGTLTVLSGSAASPYDDWATGYGLQNPWLGVDPLLNGEPTANPDGDAYTNLQEFAFGFDPSVSDGGGTLTISGGAITQNGPPQIYVDPVSGQFFLRYTRRTDYLAAGLTYLQEFAADSLGSGAFEDVAGGSVVATGTGAGGVEIEAVAVEFPDALPGSGKKARFGRVGVTQTP